MVTDSTGINRSVEVGEAITISRSEFAKFDRGDFQPVQSKAWTKFADPTPQRRQAAELPDAWKSLPACFSRYHNLQQKFRILKLHLADIDQKRIDLWGSSISFGSMGDNAATALGMRWVEPANPQQNILIKNYKVDFNDPLTIYQDRCLSSAAEKTANELEKLTATSGIEIERLFLSCGNARIEKSAELQLVVDELADIGFALFSTRIKSLGLSPHHARSLYYQSADWVTHQHEGSYRGGMCILRVNEEGITEHYGDEAPAQQAGHLLGETLRLAELKPFLLEARKTLAKTLKLA
jgi:hypothetical protein